MNLIYAKWLRLPIKKLSNPRKLFNVDGTENKAGELLFTPDTILTPFSFSPSCDLTVDSLPELFLAYCTIYDMAARCKSPASGIHARPVPDPYDSDPVPLLTM
jgi:hypothetical protein